MSVAEIDIGSVFVATSEASPVLAGPHRVLQISRQLDRVTLIPVPLGPRLTPGRKQPSYYAKGFMTIALSRLEFWLETRQIQMTCVDIPSHWHLSDSQLRQLFPTGGDRGKEASDPARSPLEIKRDFKWMLIAPLIAYESGSKSPRPPDLSSLDALVKTRARETGVSAGQVFDALHRFYAFGCIRNSLLPNTTTRSGAPGQPRRAKKGVKLGRKNAAVKAGHTELAGLALTDKDVQNLEDAYVAFVIPGTSVKQAFLSMSATYYSKGHIIKHGYAVPDLYPSQERPTEREFRHHGPQAKDAAGAARRLMGEGQWARDYRPLVGTARDGITTIGQVGSLDASPVDVNFVSCSDPRQPIGVGRGLFVRDAWLGLYLGFHVTQNGLGTDDAKLAILRAATDKSATLRRYGLDLPSEDFPSIFFSKYLSDNGELRSRDGIESLVDQLTSRIEFVASGRADRNSSSESGHHGRHRGFDHHITGSTKGRAAKRGEPLAISNALITRFTYIRLLLLWIHWANTKQALPLHMVPIEMQREFASRGKPIARTRIEIYRWASANGYVAGMPMEATFLRSHLLPRFTASVQRNGLVLHRPDSGNAVELLQGARFNHAYLAHAGIIQDAVKRGKKHIEVRADPDDLSQIILIDASGIHVIPNIKDDLLFIQEGGIPDLCATNDAQKLRGVMDASSSDQDAVEQQAFRKEAEADARGTRKEAIKTMGPRPKNSAKRAGVRAAQAIDRRDQMNEEVHRVAMLRHANDALTTPVTDPSQVELPSPAAVDPTLAIEDRGNRLMDIRKRRLSSYINERKY